MTVGTAADRGARIAAPTRRTAMPAVAVAALVSAVLLDTTTNISLGPINLSGVLTIALAATFAVLAPLVAGPTFRALPTSLVAFGVYITVWLALAPSAAGVQNVSVIATFLFCVLFSSRASGEEVAEQVVRAFAVTGLCVSMVFVMTKVVGLDVYGSRSFGLTALVLLSAAVVVPATGAWNRWAPLVIAGATVFGLSRTASALSLVVLTGLVVRLRRGHRLLVAAAGLALAAVIAIVLVVAYAPLRNRFLTGDNAVQIGGLSINTSGRSAIWDAVVRSYLEQPLFGKGPGSAVEAVSAQFVAVREPHNEYLRILHDYGVVGMVLFGLGAIALVVRIISRGVRTDHPVHWAAAFSLLAVLAAAITDNILVYPFVMLPLAVLVGLSLGLPPRTGPFPTIGGAPR